MTRRDGPAKPKDLQRDATARPAQHITYSIAAWHIDTSERAQVLTGPMAVMRCSAMRCHAMPCDAMHARLTQKLPSQHPTNATANSSSGSGSGSRPRQRVSQTNKLTCQCRSSSTTHVSCMCRVTRSQRLLTRYGRASRTNCSEPQPQHSVLHVCFACVGLLGAQLWSSQLSAPNPHWLHRESTLGYELRGDREFASRRAARHVSS